MLESDYWRQLQMGYNPEKGSLQEQYTAAVANLKSFILQEGTSRVEQTPDRAWIALDNVFQLYGQLYGATTVPEGINMLAEIMPTARRLIHEVTKDMALFQHGWEMYMDNDMQGVFTHSEEFQQAAALRRSGEVTSREGAQAFAQILWDMNTNTDAGLVRFIWRVIGEDTPAFKPASFWHNLTSKTADGTFHNQHQIIPIVY